MNIVNIYARVSTEDQKVRQQANYVKEWCLKQGYVCNKIVMDEESGRLPLTERKKFMALLDESLLNANAIVVQNLERLTRNWNDVVYIEKFFRENWDKLKLISTADSVDLSNANGRLMFRIRMAVACQMPEDMLEKARVGIERAKKEGKYLGRPKGAKNRG